MKAITVDTSQRKRQPINKGTVFLSKGIDAEELS